MTTPVIVSWSGGKDSAMMLEALHLHPDYEPAVLLTTLSRDYDRIAMHGIRRELLEAQAEAAGLPLATAWIQQGAGNAEYEAVFLDAVQQLQAQGYQTIAFGDLFLEEIRQYRENLCRRLPIRTLYPLWGRPTDELAAEFIHNGFRARLCCVDTQQLPEVFCGKELDADFLQQLPAGVDPCGENGEFHTFVYEAPCFREAIPVISGRQRRDGQFLFQDFTLTSAAKETA